MEVSIRRARPGDESALAYIQTESWKSAFAQILDHDTLVRCTDFFKAENMYRSLLAEDRGYGYLMTLDGKPHCIAWWNAARDADKEGSAELICIHSLPDNRHKGYGGMMMARVLEDIRDAGYSEVVLWVFTENVQARSFYESWGFSATETLKQAFGSEEIRYIKVFAA